MTKRGTQKETIGNWFAINRQLIESDFWQSEPFTKPQAWVDMIGLARFKSGFGYKRSIEIPLNRGQHCWSEVNLAKRWGWSRGKVKRFMEELKTKQQIVQHSTNVTTVTTIVNYELYQPNDTADKTPSSTPDSTADGQQTDTKEECNNVKKEIMEELPLGDKPKKEKFIPPCIEEVRELIKSYCMERKLNIEIMQVGMMAEDFHDHYENTGWKLSAGKGALMKRWDLALKKWVRNAFKNGELDRTAK